MKFPLRSLRAVVCSLGLLTIFPTHAYAQKVLLLAAEDPAYAADVRLKLVGTGLLTVVDVIDVRGTGSTPTLATLLDYDAVMTWSNNPYGASVALGNVLADYVDSGRGVVQAPFSQASEAAYEASTLGGRWQASYEAYTRGETGALSLTIEPLQPSSHPILEAVKIVNSGAYGFHHKSVTAASGGEVVARWSNGELLVGTRIGPQGGRVVGLNMYPPSNSVFGGQWDATTDGALLMANALVFAAGPPAATDTTAPVLSNVPSSMVTATATSAAGATVAYGPVTALDAVDGSVLVTCSPSGVFPIGDTLVTCAAEDTRANSASATFTVRVLDATTPGKMWGEGSIRVGTLRHKIEFAVSERAPAFEGALVQVHVKNEQFPSKGADRFWARTTDFVAFSDDPSVRPGVARVDTVVFSGTGDWNGVGGYRYQMSAVDKGDADHARMYVRLTVTAPNGLVVASVDGTLGNGSALTSAGRRR